MNPQALENLTNKIKGLLINCTFRDNELQHANLSSHLDSLSKELLKHRKDYLDGADIYFALYDHIYSTTQALRKTNEPKNGCLWDLLGEEANHPLLESIKEAKN